MYEYVITQGMLGRLTRLGKDRCSRCNQPLKVRDRITSTRSRHMRCKPYLKACFEKMLY